VSVLQESFVDILLVNIWKD